MHQEKQKIVAHKNVFDSNTIFCLEYHKRNAIQSLEAMRAIIDRMPDRPYTLSQQLAVAIMKADRIELGGLITNVTPTQECTGDGGEDIPTAPNSEHP